ncbi:MAG: hypothetical protein OEN02_14495 [Gammaproteobacteria bacterium]|nr:hypothetical protein [Gammaproteobacteria bacterium]MDH3537388.1 hypothetical protein [Gammaproteobacteria bacterium]
MKSASFTLALTLLACLPANANEPQMIISGKTIHVGSNNLNEKNYGLGLQYDFATHQRWIPLINLASLEGQQRQHLQTYRSRPERSFQAALG